MNKHCTTAQKAGERDLTIDAVKLLACFAVVGLHTLSNQVLYNISGCAIPLFFISSGFFVWTKRDISVSYLMQKIFKILRLIVLWVCTYEIAMLIFRRLIGIPYEINLLAECMQTTKKALLQQGSFWHFWYLGGLILLYLTAFVTDKIFHAVPRKKLLTGIMLVTGFICLTIQLLSYGMHQPLQNQIIQPFRLWTWVFYSAVGGMLRLTDYFASIKTKFIVISFPLIAVLSNGFFYFVERRIIFNSKVEYMYDSIS